MSIAVSVLTTSRVARNSGGAARQERNPQSATAYSSVRYSAFNQTQVRLVYWTIAHYSKLHFRRYFRETTALD